MALLLNVAVGFFMDFRAEHEIAALQALTAIELSKKVFRADDE